MTQLSTFTLIDCLSWQMDVMTIKYKKTYVQGRQTVKDGSRKVVWPIQEQVFHHPSMVFYWHVVYGLTIDNVILCVYLGSEWVKTKYALRNITNTCESSNPFSTFLYELRDGSSSHFCCDSFHNCILFHDNSILCLTCSSWGCTFFLGCYKHK